MSANTPARWSVTRFAQRPETPWSVNFSGVDAWHPDSTPALISGGEHATWSAAFAAALEGAALTSAQDKAQAAFDIDEDRFGPQDA